MRRKLKTILSLLACGIFFVGILHVPMIATASDVKISDVDYKVTYDGAKEIFLFNKKSIGSAVGTEVYLTYTVDKVEKDETNQQGVAATGQPNTFYPYATGAMEYNDKKQLLEEGYTYFFKFKVTKDGFAYDIIKAKGKESTYLNMVKSTGAKTDKLEYFGLWLAGGEVTAQLSSVRCYDREGNDLGVTLSRLNNATCTKDVSYTKNTNLDHEYTVTIEKQSTLALCNQKAATSNTVYMEYTVKASNTSVIQTGLLITQDPTANYPYSAGSGYMQYENMKEKGASPLLTPGADYIICMEKKKDTLEVTVQRTYKGEKTLFSFPSEIGEYKAGYPYFGLWLGEGSVCPVNCVLTNFKCYDSNNTNLGVQCNRIITAVHSGEIEDYAGCDAVYYCEQDQSSIVLYPEWKMVYVKDGKESEGTYRINDSEEKVITLSYGEGKEMYSYLYKRITSEDEKVYNRLGTYNISFVTGTETDIEKQIFSAENGYIAKKPKAPQKKDATFVSWVTRDGKDFDFDKVVTKSAILYAKWVDGDGRETIALLDERGPTDYLPYVAYGASALILIGAVVGAVFFVRKGGSKREKE